MVEVTRKFTPEFTVFVIDFFFSVNEPFFFVALLMTLLYVGALQEFDAEDIQSKLNIIQRGLQKVQIVLDAVHYILYGTSNCCIYRFR